MDLQILSELSNDASISVPRLSKKINVNSSVIYSRIKRLVKRKYSVKKIRDNLDAEIFDVCLNEAKEKGHFTFIIDSTIGIKKDAIDTLIGEIGAM